MFQDLVEFFKMYFPYLIPEVGTDRKSHVLILPNAYDVWGWARKQELGAQDRLLKWVTGTQ